MTESEPGKILQYNPKTHRAQWNEDGSFSVVPIEDARPIEDRLRTAELRRQSVDTERKQAAEDLRALILEAREGGMKPGEIAAAMGPDVNRQTVYRILDRR